MVEKYTPELGQFLFGQYPQEYEATIDLECALTAMLESFSVLFPKVSNPFTNSGGRFKTDVFEVEAYSWADPEDYDQPYNLKWNSIEVKWYKHAGRGVSVNKALLKTEVANMLSACLTSMIQVYRGEADATFN